MASLLLDSSVPESILGNQYNGRENGSPLQKMGNVVLRSLARSCPLSRALTHAHARVFII